MKYKNPDDALKTREEGGYRIALHDANIKFPTEETIKAAIKRVNDDARGHELKPCPSGQECPICFAVKATAESEVLTEYAEKSFHAIMGPLAHVLVDFEVYYAFMHFFMMLGEELGKSVKDPASEIDALTRMFQLPSENKPASDDGKTVA